MPGHLYLKIFLLIIIDTEMTKNKPVWETPVIQIKMVLMIWKQLFTVILTITTMIRMILLITRRIGKRRKRKKLKSEEGPKATNINDFFQQQSIGWTEGNSNTDGLFCWFNNVRNVEREFWNYQIMIQKIRNESKVNKIKG